MWESTGTQKRVSIEFKWNQNFYLKLNWLNIILTSTLMHNYFFLWDTLISFNQHFFNLNAYNLQHSKQTTQYIFLLLSKILCIGVKPIKAKNYVTFLNMISHHHQKDVFSSVLLLWESSERMFIPCDNLNPQGLMSVVSSYLVTVCAGAYTIPLT